MNRRPNKVAVVDTGFWIALLHERDQHHSPAQNKAETLRNLEYILPWPTLYETLNTRLVRRPELVKRFVEGFLKRPNAHVWDDSRYRDEALEKTLSDESIKKRPISLVDNVLRAIIADTNVKINCLFTFNIADFADICRRRNVEIL